MLDLRVLHYFLTEDGLFLKKRAEEILSLASHTEEELRSDNMKKSLYVM